MHGGEKFATSGLIENPEPTVMKVFISPRFGSLCAFVLAVAAPTAGHATLGDCMQRADPAMAVTACLALVKSAGKDRKMLGTGYAFLGPAQRLTGDLRGALRSIGQALIYDPRNARLWHERGLTRAALGQTLRASADETFAIRYEPRMVEAWIARGDLFRKLGFLAKAVADANEALKLDPKNFTAFANRAYARLRLGQFDAAKADAEVALQIEPKSAKALLTRGLVLERSDKAKALEDIKASLAIEPNDKIAQDALKRLGG
jgi:tetratricopeptide (TPR) repeat protein